MKTFAISLKRVPQRYNYIQKHLEQLALDYELVDAVDGQLLTLKDLEASCDMEAVNAKREWLTNGMLACAMSHYSIYEKIVANNYPCALIVEDDVLLPKNIKDILNKIEPHLKENEVLMLYYISFNKCLISSLDSQSIGRSLNLNYPMNPHQTICTAAYIVTYEAAKSLLRFLKPFRVSPDSFGYMYEGKAIENLRVLFPQQVKVQNFKSSIDYLGTDSLLQRVATLIDRYKVPILYQLLRFKRKNSMDKMYFNFELVNEKSPIAR